MNICDLTIHSIYTDFNKSSFFFFNDPATTEIYTLSLHDALPICAASASLRTSPRWPSSWPRRTPDRKSTRLNSSHSSISYAVFCLKKKNKLINVFGYHIRRKFVEEDGSWLCSV